MAVNSNFLRQDAPYSHNTFCTDDRQTDDRRNTVA